MHLHQLYIVALVCPEPLQSEISAIKNYFFEKYNCKVALKSPAHVTLIPPFELKQYNEDQLKEFLMKFKTSTGSINISINGYDHFAKRTIFLRVNSNEALVNLQKDLQTFFRQKQLHIKANEHFKPHITVANRDIKPDDYDKAWQIFKDKGFNATFTSRQFALLKLTDKKWKIIAEYNWEEK